MLEKIRANELPPFDSLQQVSRARPTEFEVIDLPYFETTRAPDRTHVKLTGPYGSVP